MTTRRTTRRMRLTAGALCGAAFLPVPAAAEVATQVTIDPGQLIGIDVAATVAGDSIVTVLTLLGATGSAALAEDSGNLQLLDIAVGADLAVSAEVAGAAITAVARGNSDVALIGLLPAPPADAALAGAGTAQGLVLRDSTVFAEALENVVGLSVEAGLPSVVAAEVNTTRITADAVYNRSLGSIETLPSASLRDPAGPASYVDSGTSLVELEASYSVVTTQVNSAFVATPGQGQLPDLPAATALADGNAVTLEVVGTLDNFVAGALGLADNRIGARAGSNAVDASILLRNEIAADDGTTVGPGVFDGTALIYSLQNSDDVSDQDADFLGQGIVALNRGASIVGTAAAGSAGQGGTLSDSMTLSLERNDLVATATINDARSEIAFEPALNLIGSGGTIDQGAGEAGILLQERLGLRDVLADYVIVARQSVNRREDVDPVANALLLDGSIVGALVTPAGATVLEMVDNDLEAVAAGNRHEALLHNRLDAAAGDQATVVDTTLAALNWQWVTAPEIVARIDSGGTAVEAIAMLLAPGDDQGAVLTLNDNGVMARADGNRGTLTIAFSALDLTFSQTTDGPAGTVENAAATLSSDRGATNAGDTFSASAGGVAVSYQVLDSADADHGETDFLTPGVRVEVTDSAIAGTAVLEGGRDADDLLSLELTALRNTIEGRAVGNSFAASQTMQADGLFTGSLGIIGVQIGNDQGVSSTVLNSGLSLTLDAVPLDAGDFAAAVRVAGNSLVSVAGVNANGHVIGVAATRLSAAGRNSLTDPGDPSTTLGGLIQGYQFNAFRVTRHTSFANAAFAILNDQTVDEGDASAELLNSGLTVAFAGDFGAELANANIRVDQNTLVAQARLNDGSHAIVLDIATLAEIDPATAPGPLAGLVSFQGSGQGYVEGPDEPDLIERESLVQAVLEDSGILVEIPELLHGRVAVAQNLLAATASANVADNAIQVTAVTLRAGLGEPSGVAILDNGNATDFDLAVLGSVYIANSQRNEWQLFGGGPGPAVVAYQGGEAGIRVVSSGEFESGLLDVVDNAIVAEARANVAENSISLNAVSLEATAGIVNRQSNGGDVTATIENAPVMVELNAGADPDASEASVVRVQNNAIESLAIGNAVLNAVSATAQGSFENPDPGPAVINEDLPATTGETEVTADYAILNRQVNAGTEDRPLEIASSVTASQIVVTMNGNHDATAVTVGDNRVSAAAYGNIATNTLSLQAAGDSMPGSAIVNQQNNSFANISASVSGGGVQVNLNGVGPGASVYGGPNGVSATAVGNSAVNTMVSRSGGPGPSN